MQTLNKNKSQKSITISEIVKDQLLKQDLGLGSPTLEHDEIKG